MDKYPYEEDEKKRRLFIKNPFFSYRDTYQPWYDEHVDYNTNAKSYYDYLARFNSFIKRMVEAINRSLRRNLEVKDTKSVQFIKKGDWIDNGQCGLPENECIGYDDVIKLEANVKISSETENKNYASIKPKNFTIYNGTKIKNDGVWSPDYGNVLDGVDNTITDLNRIINELKNQINNNNKKIETLEKSLQKIINDLFNSGAITNNSFNYDFKPNRHIATGNINVFGGTVDGNSFIRTNNGKTENDITVGI